MPISYRYTFKPKGGYNVWVTKQKLGRRQMNTNNKPSILGEAIADIAARTIVGALTHNENTKLKKLTRCKDPADVLKNRKEAEYKLTQELGLPHNNRFGGTKMDSLDLKIVSLFPGKIVRKDLTALMKRGANVPTFVLE